jgi:hypothetical protein
MLGTAAALHSCVGIHTVLHVSAVSFFSCIARRASATVLISDGRWIRWLRNEPVTGSTGRAMFHIGKCLTSKRSPQTLCLLAAAN